MNRLFQPMAQNRAHRINVRVTKDEKQWIDDVASKKEISTSEVVREALQVYKAWLEGDADV